MSLDSCDKDGSKRQGSKINYDDDVAALILSLFRFKSGLETSLLMDFSGPVLMQHSFDKCGLKINFSVSNSSI